jgi:hypothetical protein
LKPFRPSRPRRGARGAHDRAQVLGGRDPAAQGFPQAIDGAADKLKTAIESTLGRLRNY